jgi:hypothetical protein
VSINKYIIIIKFIIKGMYFNIQYIITSEYLPIPDYLGLKFESFSVHEIVMLVIMRVRMYLWVCDAGEQKQQGVVRAAPSTEGGRVPPRLCIAPTSSTSVSIMIDEGWSRPTALANQKAATMIPCTAQIVPSLISSHHKVQRDCLRWTAFPAEL